MAKKAKKPKTAKTAKTAKKASKKTAQQPSKKPAKAVAKKSGAKKKDGRINRQSWSQDDIKQLKTFIKENTPTRLIAMKLKRSEIWVRGKVQREGLSLRPTNRSPRD
jgi:hypothetical protein